MVDALNEPGAESTVASTRCGRWAIVILVTMYAGYAAFMLCRNTLIAASPTMLEDATLGIAEDYGWSVFLGGVLTVTLLALVTTVFFLHPDALAAGHEATPA